MLRYHKNMKLQQIENIFTVLISNKPIKTSLKPKLKLEQSTTKALHIIEQKNMIASYFLDHLLIQRFLYLNNQIVSMGPVVLVIEIVGIITTVGVIGQTIAIEVIQEQIKSKIKEHQRQFDALKDIQAFLKQLLQQQDIQLQDELSKQALFQNISQIQAFIQITKQNFQKLVRNFPKQLAGRIVPTKDQEKKILATYKKNDNLQNAKYFINKSINSKEEPSFAATSLKMVSSLQGVDWDRIKKVLLGPGLLIAQLGISAFTLKSVLTATKAITSGVVLGSILSAIGIVFNIYNIVDNAFELKKLVDQKDQIYKQIGMLPQTELDTMNVIKGSLSAFLVFLVVGGDLITRIRQKLQFIAIFTTNQEIKQSFQTILNKISGPHTIIPIQAIQQTSNYAAQLQSLYKWGIDKNNVKDKILEADTIFKNFFVNVNAGKIHTDLVNALTNLKEPIKKANQQYHQMKMIPTFINYVIDTIMAFQDNDHKTSILIKSYYEVVFFRKEDSWTAEDKLRIVLCIAGMKQRYYADDPSGQTYLGYRLTDYRNNVKSYADVGKIDTNSQDITQYETDWIAKHSPNIVGQLKKTFKNQTQFLYYRSTLNFYGVGALSTIQLQVNKSMFYKGLNNLYRADCGLEQSPQFKLSIWTGEKLNDVIVEQSPVVLSYLQRGCSLSVNQYLKLDNYYAIMQQDGNLVVYNTYIDPRYAIWASNTNRQFGSYILAMQNDGNVVIYNQAGTPIWATGTWNLNNNYFLNLGHDGRLRVQDQFNNQIWVGKWN